MMFPQHVPAKGETLVIIAPLLGNEWACCSHALVVTRRGCFERNHGALSYRDIFHTLALTDDCKVVLV
jgi:hypothetical protein